VTRSAGNTLTARKTLCCWADLLCALQPLQITNGTVEFQDVVFGYGKQPPPDNGSSGPGGAAGGAHEDQQHNGSGHESPEDAGTAKHSRESTPEKGEPDGNGNNGHHDSRSIIVSQSSAHPDHDIEPLPGPFQQKLGLSKRASSSLLTGLGRCVPVVTLKNEVALRMHMPPRPPPPLPESAYPGVQHHSQGVVPSASCWFLHPGLPYIGRSAT
jgi:hypothetical protein